MKIKFNDPIHTVNYRYRCVGKKRMKGKRTYDTSNLFANYTYLTKKTEYLIPE